MKTWQKAILSIICVLGMGVSFAHHLFKDPDIVGEIKAPVHVNIEIDKNFIRFVSVIATLNPDDTLYHCPQRLMSAAYCNRLFCTVK